MPILDDLTPRVDEAAFRRALRVSDAEGEAAAAEILAAALSRMKPRAFFLDAFVDERGEGTVTIGGQVFHSRILRANLDRIDRVFPFVITIGGELEKAAAAQDDLLRQYAYETAADMALHAAAARLEGHLRGLFKLGPLSAMDPGSLDDWPIREQVPLFALLGDTEARIGVRLTDSLLMVPRKSISGILFPSEESFNSCSLCPRRRCQGRREPYDAAKRASYGLEVDE